VAAPDDAGTGESDAGYASHAALLARGRGIPLLFVASHVAHAIREGDMIVLDTRPSPARLWASPSEARVAEARAALADDLHRRHEAELLAAAPLAHLPAHGGAPFAVRVNVGTGTTPSPRRATAWASCARSCSMPDPRSRRSTTTWRC
jgi:phosphoenolpyruvate-protein kinase (PTS system EI component)